MDASGYRVGDRVRLVSMDDPYRQADVGILGTVTGVAPKPINVLDVDWDDGFGLNPCLDVDVVQKVGNVMNGREFYTVETNGGKKVIKYDGFTWRRQCDEPGLEYACTTICGCYIEAGESNYDRMTFLAESCQQYQDDMGMREYFKTNLGFYGGTSCGRELHVDLVDADTPDGEYHFECEGM